MAVLEAGREHAERAVVLHQQSLRGQLVDHHREQRVVEALADGVLLGEENPEHLVDLAGVAHALGHEDPPQPHRLGVAGLEQDDAEPAALGEIRIAVELRAALRRRTRSGLAR